MTQTRIIRETEAMVRSKLEGEASGHDWWHIYRVAETAKRIAEEEKANVFICVIAALLHDLADEKLCPDPEEGMKKIHQWMESQGMAPEDQTHVLEIISGMSFKGGGRPPMRTEEGRIVQDADRLDAIGAIGISRVFAYSGAKARPIHDPNLPPRASLTEEEYRSGRDTGINHFYEKLLKLKALMNTETAKRLAVGRHRFLEAYLEQFYAEWEGKR